MRTATAGRQEQGSGTSGGSDATAMTPGPFISCPAHSYIFDLATGSCLSEPRSSSPLLPPPRYKTSPALQQNSSSSPMLPTFIEVCSLAHPEASYRCGPARVYDVCSDQQGRIFVSPTPREPRGDKDKGRGW
eukprot:767397-Hanusia_phi.AAC.1